MSDTPSEAAQIELIIQAIGATGDDARTQRIQSQFRAALVNSWDIAPGARVLEIGCGQGDMTAVLAQHVGPFGHVTAVDPARADYGAPLTVGQATARIRASHLGERIDFHLGCDLLDEPSLGTFDYVVFAHCSWYFHSAERLARTLAAAMRYAPVLCFSEWDNQPRHLEQMGHLLAVQILEQVAYIDRELAGNVQTPLARATVKALIKQAGWTLNREKTLADKKMQDGSWEVEHALSIKAASIGKDMPAALRAALASQIELLRTWKTQHAAVQPLDSYSLCARRELTAGGAMQHSTRVPRPIPQPPPENDI
ncbi:class I SAM-dependent methyltransferase [Pseudomonas tolaasii]